MVATKVAKFGRSDKVICRGGEPWQPVLLGFAEWLSEIVPDSEAVADASSSFGRIANGYRPSVSGQAERCAHLPNRCRSATKLACIGFPSEVVRADIRNRHDSSYPQFTAGGGLRVGRRCHGAFLRGMRAELHRVERA